MHSIIFLEYDPQGINRTITHESLASIVQNSTAYDYELIHVKNVKGFVTAVNEGLARAKGEWLVVVANDVVIDDPEWLTKLSVDNVIASWQLTPFFITKEMRADFACWCISRKVYETIGPMSTEYANGYGYDDDDYIFTAKQHGILSYDAKVSLKHLESMTYNTIFKEEKRKMTVLNESIFRSKWNL